MSAPVGDRVAAARLWASAQLPYLSAALFACPVRPAPGTGAIVVDRGWRVRADPEVVAQLAVPELGRLLLHLVGHLVRGHGERADAVAVRDEDRPRWNRCADAELNDDLRADGLVPARAPTLPADLGRPDGRLAEWYFAGTDGPGPPRPACGSGAYGGTEGADGTDGTDADGGALPSGQATLVRHAVAAEVADQHRREPGRVPAGWVRWAHSVLESQVDWRRLLGAEVRRALAAVAGAVDFTYRRPHRRTDNRVRPRPVLPALHRPVPSVAVVCDTSGSMGEPELAQVLGEIDALLRRAGLASARLPVLAVDTEVHAVRRVNRAGQVPLVGGGGTDMAAGIEAAAALRPRPDVIVVLTDGWTPWPDAPPRGCRVVVGVIGGDTDGVPGWARAVPVDLGA